jgi:hypothetical protein
MQSCSCYTLNLACCSLGIAFSHYGAVEWADLTLSRSIYSLASSSRRCIVVAVGNYAVLLVVCTQSCMFFLRIAFSNYGAVE